ncbi:hypothetical protein CAC42_6074 [Sphaceloma murrayae]|uniref:Uncharacterized protein n=1 Tax=Sphaceloma murrayae TaxID=2082308 RepID=A0A2K1QVD9_9PEZI|nr:hypothetical protein CAC42_6074 [Sphaceloma murrayae]
MFATRRDQENVTHLHAQAAAAKPLNQVNSKTPGPKAPAPKTPFRTRHDENAIQTVSKTQGGKANANLFATPATTKPRAILGAKTTNAKALATPGLGGKTVHKGNHGLVPPSAQKISPRLKRTKVKIHQPEVRVEDGEEDVADVEYCPPPSIVTPPLPDFDDDLDEMIKSGVFKKEHVLKCAMAQSLDMTDSEGLTWSERKGREAQKKQEAELNIAIDRDSGLEHMSFTDPELEQLRLDTVRKESLSHTRKGPSTLSARNAASMLGGSATSERKNIPSFAAPTKATKLRAEATGTGKENNVNDKFLNAKASSRTTMGYSRGRQVSATKRAPLSNAHRANVVKIAPKKIEGKERKLEDVVKPMSELEESDVDDDVKNGRLLIQEEIEKLAMEDFVLEL